MAKGNRDKTKRRGPSAILAQRVGDVVTSRMALEISVTKALAAKRLRWPYHFFASANSFSASRWTSTFIVKEPGLHFLPGNCLNFTGLNVLPTPLNLFCPRAFDFWIVGAFQTLN